MIRITVIWAASLSIVAGSAHAQAATTAAEQFVLTGVVFVEGGGGLAWLQEPTLTNNKVIGVRPGDRVGPYRVTKILEDQVVLEGPSGTVFVPLAGGPGTATAAAGPVTGQAPASQASPRDPDAIIIPRGDPRRSFPASDFLIGAGARTTGPVASQVWKPPAASNPRSVAQTRDVPGAPETSAPAVSSSSGQSGSSQRREAIVIPRGDPRRAFPTSDFFIGAR